MKNILTTIAILFVLLFSSSVLAQSGKKISYLDEGQQASFSGFLLSPEAYADMKFRFEEDRNLFKLKLDYEIQKAVLPWQLRYENEKDHNESYVAMCNDRFRSKDRTIKFYENELDNARRPSLWENIDFPVGIAMGTTFTILSLVLAHHLNTNIFRE